ncbi:MAG: formylglycine-generating enzyme family protein [Candidatus Acetothermia bacterium]|nr:formylglycine-generating enzyme family protein [Candidatus Acetothermia bacterium]
MAGNVGEWVWDWYDLEYYASSPGTDPRGPASGWNRVARGGSWLDLARDCRVAFRYYGLAATENFNLGFRLVRPGP